MLEYSNINVYLRFHICIIQNALQGSPQKKGSMPFLSSKDEFQLLPPFSSKAETVESYQISHIGLHYRIASVLMALIM